MDNSHQAIPQYPQVSSSAFFIVLKSFCFSSLPFLYNLQAPFRGVWGSLSVWGPLRSAMPHLCIIALGRDYLGYGLPLTPLTCAVPDHWLSQASYPGPMVTVWCSFEACSTPSLPEWPHEKVLCFGLTSTQGTKSWWSSSSLQLAPGTMT